MDRSIDFPEDDPQVVDMMLQYFYQLDYHLPLDEIGGTSSTSQYQDVNEATPQIYADEFIEAPIQYTAIESAEESIQESAVGLAEEPIQESADEPSTASANEPGSENSTDATSQVPLSFKLTFHAKVYTLAEKCWIDDLKQVAIRKFEEYASEDWALDDFVAAAQEVYGCTIDTDRGLRDIVLKTLCDRRGILDQQPIQSLVKEVHALAYDMVKFMHPQLRY